MSSSAIEIRLPTVVDVRITDDTLTVDLSDGRSLSVPLAWFPRLVHGSTSERADWQPIGGGHGVHWSQLDEDISVENLIAGHPSGESNRSLQRWLDSRES